MVLKESKGKINVKIKLIQVCVRSCVLYILGCKCLYFVVVLLDVLFNLSCILLIFLLNYCLHLWFELSVILERFSFACRKVIGFALSTRCDWLKRFAPPFHPIRSKTKANCDALARFSRALRQPHVITSSFDWFNVLSVSYVIGQSNYFGFGFTTLKRKPLYCLCSLRN